MATPSPHLVLSLASAGSGAISEAARLLQERGYEVLLGPGFNPDSGGVHLRKGEVEVQVDWFAESGVRVLCRNRAFDQEKKEIVELLRTLKNLK
jgi:hypothetical protein